MTSELDPQLKDLLEAADAAGVPAIHSFSYLNAREFYNQSSMQLAGDPPDNLYIYDNDIELSDRTIPTRVYRPENTKDLILPALIYFHGGGWCIGSLDSHDHVCRWLASQAECVVISVDYRMGPEHKFPAAAVDALEVTQWLSNHASEFIIDNNRIAIGGDSAGGNLSAVVTLLAKEQGGPKLCCQLLIYPATDM